MRSVPAVLTLNLLVLQSHQPAPPNIRIAQVPDGTNADKTYLNDALDISFRIRHGWAIALIQAGAVQSAAGRAADDP
jgi:hypothetical protein